MTCDSASFEDLVDEAVELDGEVKKLDLRLEAANAGLADKDKVIAVCTQKVVALSSPRPWVKYGYGLGLVGAFALATSVTTEPSPEIKVGLGLGGLGSMLLGYWLVTP